MKGLPAETPQKMGASSLLRLAAPRNVEEGVRYCKYLLEHFPGCDPSNCKHFGKKGCVWVLKKLGFDLENSKMVEIRLALTTHTTLFSLPSR